MTLLSACAGDPEWVAAYEECKQKASEIQSKMETSSRDSDENPQTRAMLESMNAMATNMVMATCEVIRTTCEEDPDGAVCRAYVERPNQN